MNSSRFCCGFHSRAASMSISSGSGSGPGSGSGSGSGFGCWVAGSVTFKKSTSIMYSLVGSIVSLRTSDGPSYSSVVSSTMVVPVVIFVRYDPYVLTPQANRVRSRKG
ncbi:hypothetical protein DYU11_18530 [Fibrisoma montanum]|uniref:Uncharacterized protein n=1 Tax=Fibrisoma montanum TaxID=2305895 RepID=A0A418M697_9BACT|nr:hypothetical protein DYU11_18530 [Fibrisoma montanum]